MATTNQPTVTDFSPILERLAEQLARDGAAANGQHYHAQAGLIHAALPIYAECFPDFWRALQAVEGYGPRELAFDVDTRTWWKRTHRDVYGVDYVLISLCECSEAAQPAAHPEQEGGEASNSASI